MIMKDCFSKLESFAHADLFTRVEYPWEILSEMNDYIQQWFQNTGHVTTIDYRKLLPGVEFHRVPDTKGTGHQNMMVVSQPVRLQQPVCIADRQIHIGMNTLLEPAAIIKSPCIIGGDCEIRHTAYLRGNVILGDHCVAGHATEIKNSLFMDGACAGHFAYVGDSVLGREVNLGAGTKLANLEFRVRNQKNSRKNRAIVIKYGQQLFTTGRNKLGAILGDYVETGCNSVLAPGAVVGCNSWIYPNIFVAKGIYAPGSRIKELSIPS